MRIQYVCDKCGEIFSSSESAARCELICKLSEQVFWVVGSLGEANYCDKWKPPLISEGKLWSRADKKELLSRFLYGIKGSENELLKLKND